MFVRIMFTQDHIYSFFQVNDFQIKLKYLLVSVYSTIRLKRRYVTIQSVSDIFKHLQKINGI